MPAAALLLLPLLAAATQGGICWSVRVSTGRCTDLLNEKVTQQECCSSNSVATAWSSEDLDAGALFFWRSLGGGVPCTPCKVTCTGVKCGEGRQCVLRRGLPKCVCTPADCRGGRRRGPVCGTDGRSYRSLCRLRKRACRRKLSALQLDYYGQCQSSCRSVQCGRGKHCVHDQHLVPHCARCQQRCGDAPGRPVCGADAVTYRSACHLRQAACLAGAAIPEAYKGRCAKGATCKTIKCRDRRTCLTDPHTGLPRCVTCSQRCPKSREIGGPICGNNNHTYSSWCHMIKDSCATRFVIETKHTGPCNMNGVKTSVGNTVLDGAHPFV